MARLPEAGHQIASQEPPVDYDEEAELERYYAEESLRMAQEAASQPPIVWEGRWERPRPEEERLAVVVKVDERYHPGFISSDVRTSAESLHWSAFSFSNLEDARQKFYLGGNEFEHAYIAEMTGGFDAVPPSVIYRGIPEINEPPKLNSPERAENRMIAAHYMSKMKELMGDDPEKNLRESFPELPDVFVRDLVAQTVQIIERVEPELAKYKHLDSENERKLVWTSPETKQMGYAFLDEETQIVMQIGDRFHPGVKTVDSRTRENELTVSSFSFASLEEAIDNPYTGRHSLEYDYIYRNTQRFMAEIPEHVISDSTTPYSYPTYELYRPEDADNRMEAKKYLDGLAQIMGDSKEDFQQRFPELPADFVDEFYETRQALIQQIGAELVAYQTIRTDAEKAMALADELLGYEAMRKAYLDPVTSYALQNDGAGYNREVTVFVPHGMLDEVAKSSHTSRYMTLDDAVTSYERSFRNRNEPIPWGFNDTGDAEKEGYFHAYLIQRGGEKGDGLSVHFRELERGMVKPETYVEQSRTADGEDVSLPILTGKGMVQHVTRNVSSMALDTDYKAAAFMAIHTGLADADYEPMQQKDIGSGRDPEIYTPAGKALFVPQQAGDRADITRLLDRAYGLDQNEAEKVLASVERYQSSNMEKPQTRGYGFSYSPSR